MRQERIDEALRPASASHLRPEVVVFRLRRHGRRLTLPVLALLALAAAAGYFIGSFPEGWQNVLAIFGAAAALVLLVLFPLFAWLAQTDTVTTRRIIVRRGFFVRHRTETSLGRIREVRSKRGLVQRMFGSGTIELLSGSETPLRLVDVPGSDLVVDAVQELIERSYASDRGTQTATSTLGVYRPSGAQPFDAGAVLGQPDDTGDTTRIR